MNTYINPKETQRRLDIFSNVKAANILPGVKTKADETVTDLNEVTFFE